MIHSEDGPNEIQKPCEFTRGALLRKLRHPRAIVISHVNGETEVIWTFRERGRQMSIHGAVATCRVSLLVSDPARKLPSDAQRIESQVKTKNGLQVINHYRPWYLVAVRQQTLN